MASNAELKAKILALDAESEVEGLSNKDLVTMLSALNTIDDIESADAGYTVADGKSLTTKRGILGDGAQIKAEDLAGGQEAIDAFLKSGHVVKA